MFFQNQVAKVPYCQWSNIGLCNCTSMSMVRDGPLARSYHPYLVLGKTGVRGNCLYLDSGMMHPRMPCDVSRLFLISTCTTTCLQDNFSKASALQDVNEEVCCGIEGEGEVRDVDEVLYR